MSSHPRLYRKIGEIYGIWRILDIENPGINKKFIVECIKCGRKDKRNAYAITKGCRICHGTKLIKNLVGNQYGDLTVIEQKGRNCTVKCSCGNIKKYDTHRIKYVLSCNNCSDFKRIGEKHGKLTIKKHVKQGQCFVCECECGNIGQYYLKRILGKNSCCFDCKKEQRIQEHKKLLGKKFGRFKIKKIIGQDKAGNYLFFCKCKCGGDAIRKKADIFRKTYCKKCKIEALERGSEKSNSILRETEAAAIRNLSKTGEYTLKQLSEMFGVCISAISQIKRGQQWKHVKD